MVTIAQLKPPRWYETHGVELPPSEFEGMWYIWDEQRLSYLFPNGKWHPQMKPDEAVTGYFGTKEEAEALVKRMGLDGI